jgi:hypothetical protein
MKQAHAWSLAQDEHEAQIYFYWPRADGIARVETAQGFCRFAPDASTSRVWPYLDIEIQELVTLVTFPHMNQKLMTYLI